MTHIVSTMKMNNHPGATRSLYLFIFKKLIMTWIKLVLYSSLTPLQNLTTTKRICARVRIDSEVPIISDILSTSLQRWSHNRAVNSLHLTVSKDMSGRQLALKSILTSKQVLSWSLLGWTPACFLGQLQHYLIPHFSTSVFSLYPLTLLLYDSHNVMTYTYRYREYTGANGATGIVLNNNNSNRKMPARSEEASYWEQEKRRRKRDKRAKRERW